MSFDFNTVASAVTETELPKIVRKQTGPNPFESFVTGSYADGKGRSVPLPAHAVAEAVGLIRRAAEKNKLGVRVIVLNGKGEKQERKAWVEWAEKGSNAKATIQFQAQDRRPYYERKKKGKAEDTTTTPAVENPTA